MREKRHGAVAAFLQSKLYVCGGVLDKDTSYQEISSSVEVYDPNTNLWEYGVSMRTSRHLAAVAVLDGYIYVMGGRNQSCVFSSVERFCIGMRNWERVPDMHDGRYNFGGTTINGKIYVFGGGCPDGFYSLHSGSVECFDPHSMSWTILSQMLLPLANPGAVSNNKHIYVMGGGTKLIHVYDADRNKWELGPEIPVGCNGAVLAAVWIGASDRRSVDSLDNHTRSE
ncbi:hypothetical protein RB195_015947 [Necator americanus]|uniref:Kelch repeat protein n=1 Tax=Necator americanus TaxID=51031 RepID=A0ABR1E816_NECAM